MSLTVYYAFRQAKGDKKAFKFLRTHVLIEEENTQPSG